MLADTGLSVWTGKKMDKTATNKVLTDNGATASNAAQVRKNLMAGSTLAKEIQDFAGQTRAWHIEHTLPWTDRGPRLVTTSFFLKYKEEMNRRRDHFDAMVEKLIQNYPSYVQTAQNYLGTLFNPDDYPSADEIRSKYSFRMSFTPVPQAGDLRVDLASEELEELRKECEANTDNRVKDAMRNAWDRLHTLIQNTSEKLKDEEPNEDGTEPKAKRYHATLISNATELCDMLSHLNVTDDPELDRARIKLARVMEGADIDDIKDHANVRASMKKQLDDILEDFEW